MFIDPVKYRGVEIHKVPVWKIKGRGFGSGQKRLKSMEIKRVSQLIYFMEIIPQ
jgi:hypothetical protein